MAVRFRREPASHHELLRVYFVVDAGLVGVAFDLTTNGRAVLAKQARNRSRRLLLCGETTNKFALSKRQLRIPRFHNPCGTRGCYVRTSALVGRSVCATKRTSFAVQ